MNLALHGFLLQVFVSILNLQHGRLLCSAGEPGYLDFDNLPETNFSCQGKVIGGYYADVEAGCQMFHVCTIGQKDEIMDIKFLCLNGTVFDQETRVCERVDEVDCSKSERFYNLNLELYGNNAVTLSLHENDKDDEDDLTDHPVEDHQIRTTSARPSTTSTTPSLTTTSRPSKPPSTTVASGSFQHPAGYPQHYQPQPPFPQVHTSQSKSLYDDKNGGYHHQYIFHNGGERVNNQATSYQLFSSQSAGSSTTSSPQIHPQIRYSSTVGPSPQIIQHNEPSTVTPLYHPTTIQTLLNSNANSPAALINPIFHNHGIASTTEQFVHSNNPRETSDYRDEDDHEDIRALEAIQPTNKGKVSKLTIAPVPILQESSRTVQTKMIQTSQQQQRISDNFLPTSTATIETTVRSFYPTPRPSPKPSQSVVHQLSSVTQRGGIHRVNPPGVTVPQLKPHQITINLPPPDIQRIVQNPSPLLPSQSRVIVTAKASVSDESGRPLNSTQLVTLPLPTIPASYDDYKEGDESFDPFYRDVPKIFKSRQVAREGAMEKTRLSRRKRSQLYHLINGASSQDGDSKATREGESRRKEDEATNVEDVEIGDFRAIRESLMKFRDILFSDEADEDAFRNTADEIENKHLAKDCGTLEAKSVQRTKDIAVEKVGALEDLKTDASKHLMLNKKVEDKKSSHQDISSNVEAEKLLDKKKHIKNTSESESKFETNVELTTKSSKDDKDIILDSDNDFKTSDVEISKTDAPVEIIIKEESKSNLHAASKADEKVIYNGQMTGYLTKDQRSGFVADEEKQLEVPQDTSEQKRVKDSTERESGSRRKVSRTRPSRRRISSKIKQKTKNVELTEAIQQEEEVDKTSTTIASVITATSATPSTVLSKTKAAEKIDSQVFGDSESQTSQEIDARTVGHPDSTYSKNSQDAEESKETELSFGHQITENSTRDLSEGAEQKTEYTSLKDENFTENPQSVVETESTEVTHVFEEKMSDDEEYLSREYETPDDDESNANTEEKKFQVSSEEAPNKIPSASTREADDLNEEDHSTTKYSQEVNYEGSNEYPDTMELSAENSREETSVQEDYRDSEESTEDYTTSIDYTSSEEYNDSQEDVTDSTEDAESSTEGILKFTDELPRSNERDDDAETKETSESYESDAYDYVDDNYEPENYKEMETATKSNDSREEKTHPIDDEAEMQTEDSVTEVAGLEKVTSLATTLPTTTTMSSTSTTSTTTTTTTTTTTPRPMTTTTRPTSPKFPKPGNRRVYAYIPSTTTPVPVVIKSRIGLVNPKPAKPPKSYNDLAPKPVIRKIALTRKPISTTETITTERLNTESPTETTTEYVTTTTTTAIMTESGKTEESVLENKLEANEPTPVDTSAKSNRTNKEDQLSSPTEQNSPVNSSKDASSGTSTKELETSTLYLLSRLTTLASAVEQTTIKVKTEPQETTEKIFATTSLPLTTLPLEKSYTEYSEADTEKYPKEAKVTASAKDQHYVTEIPWVPAERSTSVSTIPTSIISTTESVIHQRKSAGSRKHASFNCLEKEMYRFYGDVRDCRLFHYCSPGFTRRQVLDFRFVCEEGTAFDEETQTCRHDVRNRKCRNRSW
ncbi:uncharacterized protein [Anoplolepis gracilipes]|uniref:uncharacterized protein isoform X2 n=1 Tax=Anoplolepis gracilipes TaxID=354296 RepID=UPI003BA05D35